MIVAAEIRVDLDYAQLQRLVANGFLPLDADGPDDLSDAISTLLNTLPMPPSATPNHERRAA